MYGISITFTFSLNEVSVVVTLIELFYRNSFPDEDTGSIYSSELGGYVHLFNVCLLVLAGCDLVWICLEQHFATHLQS